MKINVTDCSNCPFSGKYKEEPPRYKCKTLGEDVPVGQPIHAQCPLIDGALPVALSHEVVPGKGAEAFLGYSVKLDDGQVGVVVRKYKNIGSMLRLPDGDAGVGHVRKPYPPESAGMPWYHVLLDGGGLRSYPQCAVTAIVCTLPRPNFNDDFDFFFGKLP